MRINSFHINNKFSFGYDRKLNTELRSVLSSHPNKDWAKTVASLNLSTNKLEVLLENEEKNKTSTADSLYQDYLDMFLSQKQMLASLIDAHYQPILNFAQREHDHYYDEYLKSGSRHDDWRKEVCDVLKELLPSQKQKSSVEIRKELMPVAMSSSADVVELPQRDIGGLNVASKVKTTISNKSFLEEYKPKSTSPSGFSDVAGMYSLKQKLFDGIIQLIQNPAQAQLDFEEYGKVISKTLLLYGPPGCGKTFITEALAAEIDVPLYLLNISKLGSDYLNQTSKNIQAAFDEVCAIADNSDKPILLFMDEMDSLAFKRTDRTEPEELKQIDTLLQAMDKAIDHNVIIIGATNKFSLLDPAIKRRFKAKELVSIPDNDARIALLQKNLASKKKGQKLLSSPEDLKKISKMLEGYSNSSICNISYDAAVTYAMHRNRADISVQDYEEAIKNTNEEKPDLSEYKSDSNNGFKIVSGFAY